MPWEGSAPNQTFGRTDGTRNGATTWQLADAAGVDIVADDHDTHDQDVASGLNLALKKDGGNTATADIPMGGNKFTNLGDAEARTEALTYGQAQDGAPTYVATVGGTADAITLTSVSGLEISAYAAGQEFTFIAASANTGAATVNVDGNGVKSIVRFDGSTALSAGDIPSGAIVRIIYDGTNFQLNHVSEAALEAADNTFSGKNTFSNTEGNVFSGGTTGQRDGTPATGEFRYNTTLGQFEYYNGTTWLQLVSTSNLPRSYIAGLKLSNNGTDGDHDIDIAVGECRDAADGADIALTAITKRLDATWVAGTGNGGLSSSLTAPANNTWYHVHAIIVSGSADVGFDTSITAANLVSDHSATSYRRIGSVLTNGSGNIIAFRQTGDFFAWATPQASSDNTITVTTSEQLVSVDTPPGVESHAHLAAFNSNSGNGITTFVYDPDLGDPTVAASNLGVFGGTTSTGAHTADSGFVVAMTDTSSQVAVKTSTTNNSMVLFTIGYRDFRGQFD